MKVYILAVEVSAAEGVLYVMDESNGFVLAAMRTEQFCLWDIWPPDHIFYVKVSKLERSDTEIFKTSFTDPLDVYYGNILAWAESKEDLL